MKRIIPLTLGLLLALAIAAPASAAWPMKDPDTWVSQWYSNQHPAIDIAAPDRAPVIAAQGGWIGRARWVRNCGGYQVYVKVRMANGLTRWHAYYHMHSDLAVRYGQRVTRGQVLGYTGSSGRAPTAYPNMTCTTGPHLHFEVWVGGVPWGSSSRRINPWQTIDFGTYLPSRYQ